MQRLRTAWAMVTPATLLALGGCGSAATQTAAPGGSAVTVSARDFAFDPPTGDAIVPGAAVTVTFVNNGAAEHSFTLDSGVAEVEAQGGRTVTLSFTAPPSGALTFHCKYHATMKGVLTVSGPSAAPTAQTSGGGGGRYGGGIGSGSGSGSGSGGNGYP